MPSDIGDMRPSKPKPATPPPREEWDFSVDRVPESELHACFLHEYARELANGSADWRRMVRELTSVRYYRDIKALMTVIRDLFFPFHLGGNGDLPYREEFLVTPWQVQSAQERQDQVNQCALFNKRVDADHIECLRITLLTNPSGREALASEAYGMWSYADKEVHAKAKQRHRGFIALDFDFPDDELMAAFSDWLADYRRRGFKPGRSQRGKTRMRQHLKALGAKRLLDAGLTVESAQDHTRRLLGEPLYAAQKTWSTAKNSSVPEVLAELFGRSGTESPSAK